jgi:hypothetical protein
VSVGVTLDCLGIARKAYCAKYFPYCASTATDEQDKNVYIDDISGEVFENDVSKSEPLRLLAYEGDSISGVCGSVCTYIFARCPTVAWMYDDICTGTTNKNCAVSYLINLAFVVMVMILVAIW